MAKIQNVDYEAIPRNAKQMRNLGKELNKEVKSAYTSAENMHNVWYGKRYGELINQFNSIIPQINEMLQLVVTDIPVSLEKVANNYSQADKGSNVTTVGSDTPNNIINIEAKNDVGLKFLTDNVEEIRGNISSNFKAAKGKMDSIALEFNKVQWQSEAADAFKNKFNTLKRDIITSFEKIETMFGELISKALQDVQEAEKANTVQ